MPHNVAFPLETIDFQPSEFVDQAIPIVGLNHPQNKFQKIPFHFSEGVQDHGVDN